MISNIVRRLLITPLDPKMEFILLNQYLVTYIICIYEDVGRWDDVESAISYATQDDGKLYRAKSGWDEFYLLVTTKMKWSFMGS